MALLKIGEGLTAFHSRDPVKGKLKIIATPEDIGGLNSTEGENKIVLVNVAGVAGLMVPLLKAAGIICTRGGIASHLAILAREFRRPCIMGASIDSLKGLEGKNAVMDVSGPTGLVFLEET